MGRYQRESFSQSVMKLLCRLLGVVLIFLLAATFGFQQLLRDIHTTTPLNLSQLSVPSPLSSGSRDEVVNILLIGQDRREGESQARSDTMILFTWNRDTDQLTMTSFLRDLYVPIPGHGHNRINAAYSFGGTQLLQQTLEETFDIAIDGSVEVDFSQFSTIIDLLGGVKLTLRQDEAAYINKETGSDLTEGTQTLSGHQALTYSRIRSLDLDGDFSRTDRQRKVMTALVEDYRNIRFSQLIPLLEKLTPLITTDLSRGQLVMLALELLPKLSDADISSQRIPADGTYTDTTIDGMNVLKADLDAARQLLGTTTGGK